jgi:hypothetical protein
MTKRLEEINEQIENSHNGIFPFIGENTVIKLHKGFYKAKKRGYYGVTAVTNDEGKYDVLLYGYYWIPEDMVIFRGSIEDTSEGKRNLLERSIEQGYVFYENLPSLQTYKFDEESEEYIAAIENLQTYKNDK